MDNEIDKRDSEDFELIRKVRADTIKTFAEKVKANRDRLFNYIYSGRYFNEQIDNLANEMMEEFR